MILKARLPIKKKLGLVAMFTGGLFATTAGFLRCVLIITVSFVCTFELSIALIVIQSGPSGPQQAGAWSCRESCIAVCVSNVPVIYPFVTRIHHRMRSSHEDSKSRQPSSYRLGPLKESSLQSFKKKKKPSPYSIPQTTVTESKDRITMMPANATDIEAGSDTDSNRGTAFESDPNNIRVVTKIGIKSSENPERWGG